VGDEGAYGIQMERAMKNVNPELPPTKRILEINASHPLIVAMRKLVAKDAKHPKLAEYSTMLYGEALLMAQLPLEDPLAFAKAVSALMAKDSEDELQ
jgi:molecular chaperone HtpG